MPHIKYSDSQVRNYLAEYFQFLSKRFSRFGEFLPTGEDLEGFNADKLSELYLSIMKECALTSQDDLENDPKLQKKDKMMSFMNSALIPEDKKAAFKEEIDKSTIKECNLFLRGMTFGEAPHVNERNEMMSYSDIKEHSVKHFKDSLNMLKNNSERTNFFGRKVKNSDEFTAVMDALEKLNNAPYNDNEAEITKAKEACENYLSTHKFALSTIGRNRLRIINSLNDRLSLSMEEVKEVEDAKKNWSPDDISVDAEKVDKYAKMIMLTNDVSLENIMDTSKDQTYIEASKKATELLKNAYLKNDTKALDTLKEKCAFALSKNLDSFEEAFFLNNEDYKKMGKDFKAEGKSFLGNMVETLKTEGYSNENKLQELSSKLSDLDKNEYSTKDFGEVLRKGSIKTLDQLNNFFEKNPELMSYQKKAEDFLTSPDSSIDAIQFRLDTTDEKNYKKEEVKADVGRMIAYSILKHEAYSANPDIKAICSILDNPEGSFETFASTSFAEPYINNINKLHELVNMTPDMIYNSAIKKSTTISSGYYTINAATNQKEYDANAKAAEDAKKEREKQEKEQLDFNKLTKEQSEYDQIEAATRWMEKNLGEKNETTERMKNSVKSKKEKLDKMKNKYVEANEKLERMNSEKKAAKELV